MHFPQVQLTGTMKVPGFFANMATSNIYFENIGPEILPNQCSSVHFNSDF